MQSLKCGCQICLSIPFTHFYLSLNLLLSNFKLELQHSSISVLMFFFYIQQQRRPPLSRDWQTGLQTQQRRRPIFMAAIFFFQLTVSGFGGFLIGSLQCFLFWLSSCPSNMTPMPPISPSLSIFVYKSLYRPSLFISDLLKCLRSRGDTLNKNPMVGMVIIQTQNVYSQTIQKLTDLRNLDQYNIHNEERKLGGKNSRKDAGLHMFASVSSYQRKSLTFWGVHLFAF